MSAEPPHDPRMSGQDETLPLPVSQQKPPLRQNAARILGSMLDEAAAEAGMEQPGDYIGPYRLCEVLGEGGF